MANFVAPTGYVDLDNDCEYSIDKKSTRSRESVNPNEDLAFYFNTYIIPKYGLNNINVSNCASFMKDLEMNWTKLTPDLQNNVMDIMVDGILTNGNPDFRNALMSKLKIPVNSTTVQSKSSFSSVKDTTGKSGQSIYTIILGIIVLGLVFFIIEKMVKNKSVSFAKFS